MNGVEKLALEYKYYPEHLDGTYFVIQQDLKGSDMKIVTVTVVTWGS